MKLSFGYSVSPQCFAATDIIKDLCCGTIIFHSIHDVKNSEGPDQTA